MKDYKCAIDGCDNQVDEPGSVCDKCLKESIEGSELYRDYQDFIKESAEEADE